MDYDCIFYDFRKIADKSDALLLKAIQQESIPILPHHEALFNILPAEGSKGFYQIVEQWEISKSSLSDIIRRYTKAGLVERTTSQEDKRSANICLTPAGVRVKNWLKVQEEIILQQIMQDFPKSEQQKFRQQVKKIRQQIEKLSE